MEQSTSFLISGPPILSYWGSTEALRLKNRSETQNSSVRERLFLNDGASSHTTLNRRPYPTGSGRRPPSAPGSARARRGAAGPARAAGPPSCPRRFLGTGARADPPRLLPPPPLSEHTPSGGPWSPGAGSLGAKGGGGQGSDARRTPHASPAVVKTPPKASVEWRRSLWGGPGNGQARSHPGVTLVRGVKGHVIG